MDKQRDTPSEEPYDPTEDPDADPEQLAGRRAPHGSQAEGDDDETAVPSPTQPEE